MSANRIPIVTLGEFRKELHALSEKPLNDKSDLESWNKMAEDLRSRVSQNPVLMNQIPHFLWHYLADADIRLKDRNYRVAQEIELAKAQRDLEILEGDT